MLSRVVRLDDRGRLVLPRDLREAIGLREGSRLLVRLRDKSIIELIPLDELHARVMEVFRRKLREWREEDHEAARLIESLVSGSGDH